MQLSLQPAGQCRGGRSRNTIGQAAGNSLFLANSPRLPCHPLREHIQRCGCPRRGEQFADHKDCICRPRLRTNSNAQDCCQIRQHPFRQLPPSSCLKTKKRTHGETSHTSVFSSLIQISHKLFPESFGILPPDGQFQMFKGNSAAADFPHTRQIHKKAVVAAAELLCR